MTTIMANDLDCINAEIAELAEDRDVALDFGDTERALELDRRLFELDMKWFAMQRIDPWAVDYENTPCPVLPSELRWERWKDDREEIPDSSKCDEPTGE